MARDLIALRRKLRAKHTTAHLESKETYTRAKRHGRISKVVGRRSRYMWEVYDAHERLLGVHTTAADVAKGPFRGTLTDKDVEDMAVNGTRFWGCRVRRRDRTSHDQGTVYAIALRPAENIIFKGLAEQQGISAKRLLRELVRNYINDNRYKLLYEVAGEASKC